jgi:hypothetical protein
MKGEEQFKVFMKQTENDLLLLDKEACVLQAEADVGAATEAQPLTLNQQRLMTEQIIRMLATVHSMTYSTNIKLLGVTSKPHIMRNKSVATNNSSHFEFIFKNRPLHYILQDVKC